MKERIRILSSFGGQAIELGYNVASRLEEILDDEDVRRIEQFEYISIHAPSLSKHYGKKDWIKYPSRGAEAMVDNLLQIAGVVGAQTIVFHPDLVDDFKWLNDKVGGLLAFENMSEDKLFGKSVKDLAAVFSKAPRAKWVCDVNHLYTIDRSMKLADEFHRAFADKLCHYHVSGYGGPRVHHDSLFITREDEILKGIKNFSAPIIDEGSALRDGEISLAKENRYILERLNEGLENLIIFSKIASFHLSCRLSASGNLL